MSQSESQSPKEKFTSLLRELFEFDCADLDFGIYRIMNYKRQVIEKWIKEALPRTISNELQRGALAEQAQAQASAAQSRTHEALEAAIYNHLYTFFSRYWQDGDFISKRRYSKKERYAIPYNGEEVYLYWANRDQYYIKTGEHFTDYTYKAPDGVTVHFKLQQANVEQNNVKGEKRFFLPLLDGITWDKGTRTLTIPFEFRPLKKEELETYGQKNQQEAIIAEALKEIPKRIEAPEALAALLTERRKTEKGVSVSLLEHHLRQYTRRNTSDFFIHKDLRGFLSRELDFYLKNEVLNLDELEAAGEHLAEGWFQLLCLIKRVGRQIIDFLAQIEDFQKMLWEKKKFITETFYVVTVGNIPEAFYPEIAACEAQWKEWEKLGMLNDECRKMSVEERSSFLNQHSSLPLDTRHFSQDFTDRLLASFDNLDDLTDGLLVHSENWQALNLLQEKYRERVKCIYIDPPYNTGNDEFIYRDAYRHSSWLAMMVDRVIETMKILDMNGVFFCSIDDHERHYLQIILSDIFGEENFIGSIEWNSTKTVTNTALLSVNHTHNLVFAKDIRYYIRNRHHFRLPAIIDGFENPDNDPRGPWKADPFQVGGVRPNQQYEIVNPKTGKVYKPKPGCSWKNDYETFKRLLEDGRIVFGKTGEGGPLRKRFLFEAEERGAVATSWWDDIETTADGTRTIQNIFGNAIFSNPKPVSLLTKIIQLGTYTQNHVVLDFFAGSGTTGHAVINLNREDGGRRKFILVEMAHYFDTVLLPRIKKVTFTPEWKDGKPKRMATSEEAKRSPRLVKVIRLESYEDALNNLTFDDANGQKALDLFKDDYLLHYMLKWETRHSETLLNVEKLQTPFAYKLRLHRNGETREHLVDLPETFNYLLGLDVQTRKVYYDEGRRYLIYRGALRNGRTVAIIWRETQGWTKEDYERDRDFVTEHKLADGADEIFVNGDSLIPGAQSLDPIFKERMFAGVEVKHEPSCEYPQR